LLYLKELWYSLRISSDLTDSSVSKTFLDFFEKAQDSTFLVESNLYSLQLEVLLEVILNASLKS